MIRRIALLALCALVLPASAAAWTWPVDGPVLRPFSFDRAHPYTAGQHRGVDLGAPAGAKVLAPADGVVSFAGTVPTGGKTVSIETPFGYTATLVHLGSIGVARGARVAEGAAVGTVGPSGVVDLAEPYVYFGLRTTGEQQGYVDPLTVLPARPKLEPPAPRPQPASEPAVAPVPVVAQPEAAPAVPAPAAAPGEPVAAVAETASVAPAPAVPAPVADVSAAPARPVATPATHGAHVRAPQAAAAAVDSRPQVEASRGRSRHTVRGSVRARVHHAVPAAPAITRRATVRPEGRSDGHSIPWGGPFAALTLTVLLCLWRRRKRLDA